MLNPDGPRLSLAELVRTDAFVLRRQGRFLMAELLAPHRVLSTSQVNGGQCENLTHLVNHQSCEGTGHAGREDNLHRLSQAEYHGLACSDAALPPYTTSLMGTAASMDYAALATETWQELSVTTCVTGGIRGNAARAGDQARWHERDGKWVAASETDGSKAMEPGTINAMVFINQPLNPAALMRCTTTLAEAKAAVLQELAAPSLQGPDTATGTGTDQFILAAPLAQHGVTEITWSGHHTKLGELVAKAMMRALRETLRWQNGLEASLTRNLGWAGRGLGLDEASLREGLLALLPKESAEMARRNFEALLHHPKVAAQVYMLRTLEERLRYGTLPATLLPELRLEQALLLAHYAASRSKSAGENGSGGEEKAISQWHQTLAPFAHDVKQLILQALALGYSAKWS